MIRKILLIAGENFSGWHRNVRIWLTFALGLVLCLMLSEQMLSRAQTYESPVQMFEPLSGPLETASRCCCPHCFC